MNGFDGIEEPLRIAVTGRKRNPSKESHVREKVKQMRHSGGGKMPAVICSHRQTSSLCQAESLTKKVLQKNFQWFYKHETKVKQDQELLHLITVKKVQRRRKKVDDTNRQKEREITNQYHLLGENHPLKIPVCKATFCSVLGISKDRVARVARYYAVNATARPEQRGGARKVDEFEAKKQLVKDHIQTFKRRASHYGRRGAPGRKYLPSDLSVKKMHKLFDQQNHDLVSYSLYYSVFRHSFNLAFGHPATDACSSCAKFHLRVKDPSLGEDEKRRETAMYILHRRRARVFYDMLGKVEHDAVTVCFDMMQNLVLPRTPISQAYYSRQLYMYVFGVVLHHGKGSRQATDDVHLYTWMEHENTKGSNMTASALDHCLSHELRHALHSTQKLRLFSDSCFGQNKNMNILSMLFAVLKKEFPQITAEYAFPIRGHSFLPVDRVFGRIEQQVRKQETTLMPEEYYNIMRNHGRVHIYGQHWQAFDFKKETQCFVKAQKLFKLSEARMLQFQNDKVGFKAVYSSDYCYHSVLKRGKTWASFRPSLLPKQSTVKDAKKRDVLGLLSEIGASDHVQAFYHDALSQVADGQGSDSDE